MVTKENAVKSDGPKARTLHADESQTRSMLVSDEEAILLSADPHMASGSHLKRLLATRKAFLDLAKKHEDCDEDSCTARELVLLAARVRKGGE